MRLWSFGSLCERVAIPLGGQCYLHGFFALVRTCFYLVALFHVCVVSLLHSSRFTIRFVYHERYTHNDNDNGGIGCCCRRR